MRWDAVPGLGYLVPNQRFFVRHHTATPLINAGAWSLGLWGDGRRAAPTQDKPISFMLPAAAVAAVSRGPGVHRVRR